MTPAAWVLAVFLVYPNGTQVTLKGGFAKSYEDCRAFGTHEVQILRLGPLDGATPKFTCKPVYEVK